MPEEGLSILHKVKNQSPFAPWQGNPTKYRKSAAGVWKVFRGQNVFRAAVVFSRAARFSFDA